MIDGLKTGWANLKARYQELLADYGYSAVAVWFSIFLLTWGGFWMGIRSGMEVDSAVAGAGTIGGAYLLTQATKPVRIVATLVITPIVATAWRKLRGHEIPETGDVVPEPVPLESGEPR